MGTLPDFLIVGAMKCGTSTLAAQLEAQPGLFMTTPKEPNFFSDDDVWDRGLDWYRGLFADAAPGDVKGEASTHYTKLPTHPDTLDRMRGILDAPRIVYVIRDPLARAISQFIHEWSRGDVGRDLREAVKTHPGIVAYGRYAMQIAPWINAYGADAVLLTSLEQMTATPQEELARIGAHLGRPDLVWRDAVAAQNVSAARVRKLPLQGLIVDNPWARALRHALVPKRLRTKIREARTYGARPDWPTDLRRDLEQIYAEDRAELARLFPEHPALTLCYPFLDDRT